MAVPIRALVLVAVGGAAGTVLRALAVQTESSALPALTLTVNLAGAFGLGLLLAVLDRRPDAPALRLILGVGVLGSFTTWSGLVVQSVLLVRAGSAWTALAYLTLSVLGGLAAAATGLRLGAGRR